MDLNTDKPAVFVSHMHLHLPAFYLQNKTSSFHNMTKATINNTALKKQNL